MTWKHIRNVSGNRAESRGKISTETARWKAYGISAGFFLLGSLPPRQSRREDRRGEGMTPRQRSGVREALSSRGVGTLLISQLGCPPATLTWTGERTPLRILDTEWAQRQGVDRQVEPAV